MSKSKSIKESTATDRAHHTIQLLQYNFDNNLSRLETQPERETFREWTINQRVPKVAKMLLKENADIIHLQEPRKLTLNDGTKIDGVTPIVEALEKAGYKVLVKAYRPGDDFAFKYITAYKAEKFTLEASETVYFTKTPSKPTLTIPNLSQTIDFIRSKLSLILLRILSAIICHVSSKKLLILSLNS